MSEDLPVLPRKEYPLSGNKIVLDEMVDSVELGSAGSLKEYGAIGDISAKLENTKSDSWQG